MDHKSLNSIVLYVVPLLFYHFWVIISFTHIWLEVLLGFEEYSELGILQWYQSIDLAQPVELAIYDTRGKTLHLLQR